METLHEEQISYSSSDHEVWSILYNRQEEVIEKYACNNFKRGLRLLSFSPDAVPDFEAINRRLSPLTGWTIYPVPGLIPNKTFFQLMAEQRFGATTWIRKKEQLDYLEEPDVFHDVYGHVPLLTDPAISGFLTMLASIANRNLDSELIIEAIARIYWYTIEFGLVKEAGETRIYGAGILSSVGETKFAMSAAADHRPFLLGKVIETPYIKDKFQEQYFVLESLTQLEKIATDLDQWLHGMDS
jgi:phenylalanine-4-hydroxylase